MKIIYLIQSPDYMPYADLSTSGRQVLLLTWKSPCPQSTLHLPNSSWNEGRNNLLEAARAFDYDYLVFLDDDLSLSCQSPVWSEFEAFLEKWQPALGYARFRDLHYVGDVNITYNIDACFNAFHADVVDVLLPYITQFDSTCWWYSQAFIMALLNLLYPLHRVRHNGISVCNTQSRNYPRDHGDWHPIVEFLKEVVKPASWSAALPADSITSHRPLREQPQVKGAAQYRLTRETIERHFVIDHPWVKERFSKLLS